MPYTIKWDDLAKDKWRWPWDPEESHRGAPITDDKGNVVEPGPLPTKKKKGVVEPDTDKIVKGGSITLYSSLAEAIEVAERSGGIAELEETQQKLPDFIQILDDATADMAKVAIPAQENTYVKTQTVKWLKDTAIKNRRDYIPTAISQRKKDLEKESANEQLERTQRESKELADREQYNARIAADKAQYNTNKASYNQRMEQSGSAEYYFGWLIRPLLHVGSTPELVDAINKSKEKVPKVVLDVPMTAKIKEVARMKFGPEETAFEYFMAKHEAEMAKQAAAAAQEET